ncbi:MAG: aldehyde dehydrogenase [Deltaproteobacteria bacterium]|nr:aldehyde dehydrogenase [Deltaproteobacteria bacterium]
MSVIFPEFVPNIIAGKEEPSHSGRTVDKFNPATGQILCRLARSGADEIALSVAAAKAAQPAWEAIPAVRRGLILLELVQAMKARRQEIAHIVALETGKSPKEAMAETDGAIQCGLFFAGEGQRLYGRTCTSAAPNKHALTIRQAVGVAGLIIAANTPIANVAWKIFPALICGNAVVLKAAEDTPATAWIVGRLAKEAGLPDGVLNIVQGLGEEAGAPLVAHEDVGVVSFTGSSAVGRIIAEVAGKRLAKVSLELGGKNPLVVCDDADLDKAVRWTILSAFSNAGQRCASGSRIIVFDTIYEEFRHRLLSATKALKVGPSDNDDFGPVINEKQLVIMVDAVKKAVAAGAALLCGGERMTDPDHALGFYMAPTILENVKPQDEISTHELFGPIMCLYRVRDLAEALALANDSPYGLTACIHTKNFDRAGEFCLKVKTGVAVVNAGTFGSEPHMPFGGRGLSGNGTREPGTEALDIYSELKDVYLNFDPDAV